MHQHMFLPNKLFSTVAASEFLHVVVRFQVICVMSLRVHGEPTNIALISLDPQMHDIQVINHVRFVLEAEKYRVENGSKL